MTLYLNCGWFLSFLLLASPAYGVIETASPSLSTLLKAPAPVTLPTGFSFKVRLQQPLSSRFNRVGDVVQTQLLAPLECEGQVIAAAGSRVHGHVEAVYPFTIRPWHYGYLQIRFERIEALPTRQSIAINAILDSPTNTKGRILGNAAFQSAWGREVELSKGSILPLRLALPLSKTAPKPNPVLE
ncbi:MAG: hypothetical protein HEQ32_06105 [Vampirovibrio sp.]